MKNIIIVFFFVGCSFANNIDKNKYFNTDNIYNCLHSYTCKEFIEVVGIDTINIFNKVLIDKQIIKALINPTYSKYEINRLAKEKNITAYMLFINMFFDMYTRSDKLSVVIKNEPFYNLDGTVTYSDNIYSWNKKYIFEPNRSYVKYATPLDKIIDSYDSFISGINHHTWKQHKLFIWYDDYMNDLNNMVLNDPHNYLESYIKIADNILNDYKGSFYFTWGFARGLAKLINIKQLYFIRIVKKMNFVDKLCDIVDGGSNSFRIIEETKQIYKNNFNKNDYTIKTILNCKDNLIKGE